MYTTKTSTTLLSCHSFFTVRNLFFCIKKAGCGFFDPSALSVVYVFVVFVVESEVMVKCKNLPLYIFIMLYEFPVYIYVCLFCVYLWYFVFALYHLKDQTFNFGGSEFDPCMYVCLSWIFFIFGRLPFILFL